MSQAAAANRAADAIVALINARVQSPTRAELVALIAESFGDASEAHCAPGPMPQPYDWRQSPEGRELLGLLAEEDKVMRAHSVLKDADAGFAAADAALDAAEARVKAFTRRMWARPVRGPMDVVLRGVLVERFADVTDGAGGNGEPLCALDEPRVWDTPAIAHLLDGCRQLAALAAEPAVGGQSPATERTAALRAAIAEAERLEDVTREGDEDADPVPAQTRLNELSLAMWSAPPRSIVDLQQRALLAKHCFRCAPNGAHVGDDWVIQHDRAWEHPEDCDDWGDKAVAHLIDGVLRYAGENPGGHR